MLRPSSSYMWVNCSAQPAMAANMPEEEPSDAAMEGTCAAWVAEIVLTGELRDKDGQPCTALDAEGLVHENGWVVDKAMCQYVDRYVKFMQKWGGDTVAEKFVWLTADIGGTPDSFAAPSENAGRRVLNVYDLKYGYDIVEPQHNTQVSIYAEAIARQLEAQGDTIDLVVIGIVQPRAWHPKGTIRKWVISRNDLADFANWIIARGELTKQPNASASPGPWCRHCPAQTRCAAAAALNYAHFEQVDAVGFQRAMTPEEMSREMEFLENAKRLIVARFDAMRKEMETRITTNHEHFPGYIMQERKGNRAFKLDAATIQLMTGVDARPDGVVTPAELERRGANIDLVEALSERPSLPRKLKKVGSGHFASFFEGRDV